MPLRRSTNWAKTPAKEFQIVSFRLPIANRLLVFCSRFAVRSVRWGRFEVVRRASHRDAATGKR
jgi:hypothetical protein